MDKCRPLDVVPTENPTKNEKTQEQRTLTRLGMFVYTTHNERNDDVMKLDGFFRKSLNELELGGRTKNKRPPAAEHTELTRACPKCSHANPEGELAGRLDVCVCGYHFRQKARRRIAYLTEPDTFEELDTGLESFDILTFPGYVDKLRHAQLACGEKEAVITGRAKIGDHTVMLFVMEPYFMMGSMGTVVGEKITRLFEAATVERLPVIGYTVSGGARMQEGVLSLMQMAKISGAVKRHSDAGLFYLTVLTDPTTGGVTASFAMEGDIILAEPGAMIGFAGQRVIEQTIRKKLPSDFQRAEFLLAHGFVDEISPRETQKEQLIKLLNLHLGQAAAPDADSLSPVNPSEAPSRSANKKRDKDSGTAAIDRVRAARAKGRMTGKQVIDAVISDFVELHGDRRFADDPAVVGGVGYLGGMPITAIALEKGKDTKDKVRRNFGAANPEGYRKALRLMQQAEKFNRPVVCFVDTAGAFCGIGAEERGQGHAIAENLMGMMALRVPIISVLIGEGGSGGALALAVADRVWMMERAIYSVISPEGCASILWKDTKKVAEAADSLRLTSQDMHEFGVVERLVPEEKKSVDEILANLKMDLAKTFAELTAMDAHTRLDERYKRFRKF